MSKIGQLREAYKVVIDGIDMTFKDFYLVNIDDPGKFNFGLSQSTIKSNSNGTRISTIKGIKRDVLSFNFALTKIVNGIPVGIYNEDLEWLSLLLYRQNETISIECNDKYCEGYVLNSNDSWLNTNEQGYINVSFETTSPYFYSPIIENNARVNLNHSLVVYDKSTVNDMAYPDIVIDNVNSTQITIRNSSNGKEFTVTNLNPNTKYLVNCERKTINNISDYKDNVFNYFNGSFIELRYGRNNFNITCDGELNISIKHRDKFNW